MELSIVSGTHNRLDLLKRMVASVRLSAGSLSYEIVLNDCGSTDGTLEWARNQPNIVLIEAGKREGAVTAFNRCIKRATGKYVVIGNDDVEFYGDTLERAYAHLESHPEVGQVAFKNLGGRIPAYDYYRGYLYGQCLMMPCWLMLLAGSWGDDYYTYAGDTQMGLRCWELGYRVVPLEGCAVIDSVYEDDLRKSSQTNVNKDREIFHSRWRNRLPEPREWQAPNHRGSIVVQKARRKELRTIRVKTVPLGSRPRIGMTTAFAKYGPAIQIDQTRAIKRLGASSFQAYLLKYIEDFKPDLIIFQEHGEVTIYPHVIETIRRDYPDIFLANFNGDARVPPPKYCLDLGQNLDINLVVSPDLFRYYAAECACNVAYWPISYEAECVTTHASDSDCEYDVAFLGSNYHARFPAGELREQAVMAMNNNFDLALRGFGWNKLNYQVYPTDEKLKDNAALYARSRLALCANNYNDLYGYSSDRLYIICASGCPVLLNRFPGMEAHGFIDGETCIAWETIPELVEKTRYYLGHIDEREAIGSRGQSHVLLNHSWDRRVEAFFDQIQVNQPSGLFGTEGYIASYGYGNGHYAN